jgi:hypothetical protein
MTDISVIPYYEDSHRMPCVAGTSANVTGGRFVDVAAAQQAGWAGLDSSLTPAGGHAVVARCAAGLRALGVAGWTVADGLEVTVYRGHTVPVVAGAAITAGAEVESDSQGRAIALATGRACGKALSTTTAAGQMVLVVVYS